MTEDFDYMYSGKKKIQEFRIFAQKFKYVEKCKIFVKIDFFRQKLDLTSFVQVI